MSRFCPQRTRSARRRRRSEGCGLVGPGCPQTVHRHSGPQVAGALSTGRPQAGARCAQPFHMVVHCSATQHPRSPARVKAVTSKLPAYLGRTRGKLGTRLGRTGPPLCTGCAELPVIHRTAGLSTVRAHRPGGQKSGPDLAIRGCPPFPQALLLRLPLSSWELVRKWALCTTRPDGPDPLR